MKITAFKNHFFDTLAGDYPSEEIGSFFNILTEELLGFSRLDLALDPEKELSEENLQELEKAMLRLQDHEPIQYITGSTEFFGLPFKVSKNVLVPRPETEELVAWILEDIDATREVSILDIGTGSGCIAISLAKNLPKATVTAIDFSASAIEVAGSNAALNDVKIDFITQNILKAQKLPKAFDLIVSNPPYVRELEKKQMQRNVLEHEPESALVCER